jgi:hypothetical protein
VMLPFYDPGYMPACVLTNEPRTDCSITRP